MFFDEKFELEFDPLAYLFKNEIDELFKNDIDVKIYTNNKNISLYQISNFNNVIIKSQYKISDFKNNKNISLYKIDRNFENENNKADYKINRNFNNKIIYIYYRLGPLDTPPKRIILNGFED